MTVSKFVSAVCNCLGLLASIKLVLKISIWSAVGSPRLFLAKNLLAAAVTAASLLVSTLVSASTVFNCSVITWGRKRLYSSVANSKKVVISKSEIVGDKDLAFNLEQKLNFTKDDKNLNAYIFKAQIYDTAESSLVDSRGISTEEIVKLTVSYQFQDKNGVIIYQDAITKDKRVSVTDNLSNNILVKNNEKKLLLDSIIQNIIFKSRVSLK